MSHKKAKKERQLVKALSAVARQFEPIIEQANNELEGDQQRMKGWFSLATLLYIEDRGQRPIEEYLPSRLGLGIIPSVFMSDKNEYRASQPSLQ